MYALRATDTSGDDKDQPQENEGSRQPVLTRPTKDNK